MNEMMIIRSIQSWFALPSGQIFVAVIARWIIFFFVPGVVLVYIYGHWKHHPIFIRIASAAVWSAILAMTLATTLERVIGRMRPFRMSSDIHLLVPVPGTYYSLPSIHASIAFACAVALMFVRPRWIGVLATVMAFLVAFGRVAAGVHYPSDVLVGAALGTFSALLISYIFKRWRIQYHK